LQYYNDLGVASFGFMSDVEWNDFQATPDFTAAIMAQKLKKAHLLSREAGEYNARNKVPRTSWNTSLDVICSMQKVSHEQVFSAVQGVWVTTISLYHKDANFRFSDATDQQSCSTSSGETIFTMSPA